MKLTNKQLYLFLLTGLLIATVSCKKKSDNTTPPVVVPPTPVIETPNEVPELPFGSWMAKTFSVPAAYDNVTQTTWMKTLDVNINFSKHITKVSRYVYGNNANCFTG